MPLEIVGVGFGRTGTDSTREALNRLGFPCYHMREVMNRRKNPGHLQFWGLVAAGEPGAQHDWEEVFGDYRACVDNPAACVWRELLEAYPDAKVLLTLHPGGPDAWYESTWETIYATMRIWEGRVIETFTPLGRKFGPMVRDLVWERFYKGTMVDRERAKARYLEHTENVMATVPADRLLIFQASEGWEPLCNFLGVEVPEGDFPRINDRASMKKMLRGIRIGAWVIVSVLALAGIVAGATLVHFFA